MFGEQSPVINKAFFNVVPNLITSIFVKINLIRRFSTAVYISQTYF